MELSSQIQAAVILGPDGSVVASSSDEADASSWLASTALELVGAARELGASQEVSRVEIELGEGALFVIREDDLTIVGQTGPDPTSGLVVYDLRTCLRSIDEKPKKKRSTRAKKEEPS